MSKLFQTSRWFLFLLCGNASAAIWMLNPSPVLTNAGIDIKVSQHSYLSAFYTLSDGTPHVTFGFKAGSSNYQIWDVNLSNSVSRLVTGTAGIPPITASALTHSNTLVLGSQEGAHIFVYNPTTGATNYIKAGADRDYQNSTVGNDGIVYFGTYPLAMIDSYNPADGTTKDWGQPDEDVTELSFTYTLGADANFIYSTIRYTGTPENFWLCITRKSDTNKTVLWKDSSLVTACRIFKGTNNLHYVLQITNGVDKWFLVTNEVPVLASLPVYDPYPQRLNSLIATGPAYLGFDIESSFDVTSASGSALSASVQFKRTNDSVYTTVTQTNGWVVAPATVDILQSLSGQLFWITDAYGPCGTFVSHGTTSITGPYKNLSTYDMLQVSSTEVYLSGYFQQTLRWNPSAAWTRVPFLSDYTDPAYNPYTILNDLGIYHYRLARGSNGNIYIGTTYDREGPGGELHWYKPSDGTTGSERAEFAVDNYDVNDLKPAVGGSKMVYVTGTSNLFVWDVATFTKTTNFAVINGVMQRVSEYESGKLIGISVSNMVGFTTAGALLWSTNLPATPWSGLASKKKVLTTGPDNYVWICAGGTLYRVNPTNGTYAGILSTTSDYNIMFNGGNGYLYGRDHVVWEIPNLLIRDIRISAVSANVGSIIKAP